MKRRPSTRACAVLSVAAALVAAVLVMPAPALAQSAPPETFIMQSPPNPSGSKEATFTFGGTDDTTPSIDLEFECRLDAQDAPPGTDPLDLWLECLSPQFFNQLTSGRDHTFEVQAIDQDGLIDPTPALYTWTVLPPQTCADASGTAFADADSWIGESSPLDVKGDDSSLKVMSKWPSENSRAVVRFPLPQAPTGCVVQSATLKLWSDSVPDLPRTLNAYRLTSGWGENNVNWANQPSSAGPPAQAPAGMGYVQWNVTGLVRAGAANGFLIRHAVENDLAGAEEGFFSKEKLEMPPELVINYASSNPTPPPPPPPPPGPLPPPPGPPPPPAPQPPTPLPQPPPAPPAPPGSPPLSPARVPQSVTLAEVAAVLKADLKTTAQKLRTVGIRALGWNGGSTINPVQALMPGTIRIDAVIAGRKVVILKGARTFGTAGKNVLRVKLTKPGLKLLKRKYKHKATLKLRGSFTNRGSVIRATHSVTLNRKGQR